MFAERSSRRKSTLMSQSVLKLQFDIIAWLERIDGVGNLVEVVLNFRPACRGQNQNRQKSAGEILLVTEIFNGWTGLDWVRWADLTT